MYIYECACGVMYLCSIYGSSDRSFMGEPIELFLVPASAQTPWYVLSCLWDGAYKRTIAVNRKE